MKIIDTCFLCTCKVFDRGLQSGFDTSGFSSPQGSAVATMFTLAGTDIGALFLLLFLNINRFKMVRQQQTIFLSVVGIAMLILWALAYPFLSRRYVTGFSRFEKEYDDLSYNKAFVVLLITVAIGVVPLLLMRWYYDR